MKEGSTEDQPLTLTLPRLGPDVLAHVRQHLDPGDASALRHVCRPLRAMLQRMGDHILLYPAMMQQQLFLEHCRQQQQAVPQSSKAGANSAVMSALQRWPVSLQAITAFGHLPEAWMPHLVAAALEAGQLPLLRTLVLGKLRMWRLGRAADAQLSLCAARIGFVAASLLQGAMPPGEAVPLLLRELAPLRSMLSSQQPSVDSCCPCWDRTHPSPYFQHVLEELYLTLGDACAYLAYRGCYGGARAVLEHLPAPGPACPQVRCTLRVRETLALVQVARGKPEGAAEALTGAQDGRYTAAARAALAQLLTATPAPARVLQRLQDPPVTDVPRSSGKDEEEWYMRDSMLQGYLLMPGSEKFEFAGRLLAFIKLAAGGRHTDAMRMLIQDALGHDLCVCMWDYHGAVPDAEQPHEWYERLVRRQLLPSLGLGRYSPCASAAQRQAVQSLLAVCDETMALERRPLRRQGLDWVRQQLATLLVPHAGGGQPLSEQQQQQRHESYACATAAGCNPALSCGHLRRTAALLGGFPLEVLVAQCGLRRAERTQDPHPASALALGAGVAWPAYTLLPAGCELLTRQLDALLVSQPPVEHGSHGAAFGRHGREELCAAAFLLATCRAAHHAERALQLVQAMPGAHGSRCRGDALQQVRLLLAACGHPALALGLTGGRGSGAGACATAGPAAIDGWLLAELVVDVMEVMPQQQHCGWSIGDRSSCVENAAATAAASERMAARLSAGAAMAAVHAASGLLRAVPADCCVSDAASSMARRRLVADPPWSGQIAAGPRKHACAEVLGVLLLLLPDQGRAPDGEGGEEDERSLLAGVLGSPGAGTVLRSAPPEPSQELVVRMLWGWGGVAGVEPAAAAPAAACRLLALLREALAQPHLARLLGRVVAEGPPWLLAELLRMPRHNQQQQQQREQQGACGDHAYRAVAAGVGDGHWRQFVRSHLQARAAGRRARSACCLACDGEKLLVALRLAPGEAWESMAMEPLPPQLQQAAGTPRAPSDAARALPADPLGAAAGASKLPAALPGPAAGADADSDLDADARALRVVLAKAMEAGSSADADVTRVRRMGSGGRAGSGGGAAGSSDGSLLVRLVRALQHDCAPHAWAAAAVVADTVLWGVPGSTGCDAAGRAGSGELEGEVRLDSAGVSAPRNSCL